MIIKYEFVTGETSEIEVGDYYGDIIRELNRKQENSNRVYRRHNYSLDAAMYQGEDYGKEESWLIELLSLLEGVTETQKRRIDLTIQGYTSDEIAEIEGGKSTSRAVRKSIELVREKLQGLLEEEK